jgi:hypothetical protein
MSIAQRCVSLLQQMRRRFGVSAGPASAPELVDEALVLLVHHLLPLLHPLLVLLELHLLLLHALLVLPGLLLRAGAGRGRGQGLAAAEILLPRRDDLPRADLEHLAGLRIALLAGELRLHQLLPCLLELRNQGAGLLVAGLALHARRLQQLHQRHADLRVELLRRQGSRKAGEGTCEPRDT